MKFILNCISSKALAKSISKAHWARTQVKLIKYILSENLVKHSRVKLFAKADHLTSKADIIHICFFSSKVMVSIWYQQVLFQSLDFIKLVLLIYHPNCWRTVVIFQVRSNMQHLAMKSLKKIRIIGWFSSQNIKYIIQCICQKAFSRCDEFPIVSALCCSQKERNCLESGFWNFTQ